jgi:hypothetical protein
MSRGRLRASMDEVSERLGQIPKDPTEAVKYLAQMEKQGWGESAFNYYMANILSGIKTHERNVLGNAFNTISRFAIKGTTAAPVDLVKSMLTGKPREVFAGESAQEAAGAYAAAGSAIRDAFDTMRHGFSPKALEEGLAGITPLYIPKKEFVGGAANPFNLVGRTLEAGDRFFVTLNRGAELYGQSYAIARKEGLARQLKGRALQDYVASRSVDLRANPGEELQRSTLKAAEKSAYREDPGPLANQIIALKKHVPAMGFVVPFVRTVSNIFRQGIEHTPLTAISTWAARSKNLTSTRRMPVTRPSRKARCYWDRRQRSPSSMAQRPGVSPAWAPRNPRNARRSTNRAGVPTASNSRSLMPWRRNSAQPRAPMGSTGLTIVCFNRCRRRWPSSRMLSKPTRRFRSAAPNNRASRATKNWPCRPSFVRPTPP